VTFTKELQEQLETILEHYGAECNCCGLTNENFLTVDRMNSYLRYLEQEPPCSSDEFRDELDEHFKLYKQIIKDGFPDDIQVLCMNCMVGTRYNGGICPHKELEGIGPV